MADSAARKPQRRRERKGRAQPGKRPRNIGDWRKRIDELDAKLVELLNERARCAAEVGQLKQRAGEDIRHPEREQEILERVQKINQGPLGAEAVKRLFEHILEEARLVARRTVEGKKQP